MPDGRALAAPIPALDECQAEAVLAPPGPLLVLAGAGSGKTRVLTERAAAMVARGGLPAEALLVITFTNKAADELRDRLEGLVGEAAGKMTIGTFHALGHRLLRVHAPRVGRTPRFSVYDGHASRRLIADALAELRAAERFAVRLVALQIGQAKAQLVDPTAYRALRDSDATRLIAAAYDRYERALERSDALDLDDLIGRTVVLLGEPDLAARYRARWRAILVDENQDTNPAQHELVRRLAAGHRNLTVAGDDDQAIYHWRGAEVSNLLGFERGFSGARVVALERNYRSTGAIVAAAARLAARNTRRLEKAMWTPAAPGPPVEVYAWADDSEEAEGAARWCAARVRRGSRPDGFAVLVRTRAQLRPLEDALLLAGVPCRVVGGQGLWESAAVRDLVAHLTLLVNPRDEIALARALRTRPGVGQAAVARVLAAGRDKGGDLVAACLAADEIRGLRGRQRLAVAGFGRTLATVAQTAERDGVGASCTEAALASGLVDRLTRERSEHAEEQLERLRRFCRAAQGYEAQAEHPNLPDFLAQAALHGAEDEHESAGLVTLSTLHAAKGCEWEHVLIAGFCEGLLPHRHALERGEVDEERRLAYVGMTRARRELALSWPRFLHGRPARASRFVAEAGLGPGLPAAPVLRRAA
jgi:DNA helicase II / ATP-dependent DNA helicase PcrA